MSLAYHGEILPKSTQAVGYTWLLEHLQLDLPLRELSCISNIRLDTQKEQNGKWTIFDAQVKVEDTISGHLEFSLKHENIDLLLLKSILNTSPMEEILEHININPKAILKKKIWFFYEFLLQKDLPIDDLPAGKYDDLINSENYFVKNIPIKFKRHKINYNLLGTYKFCPIIRKTEKLKDYIGKNLSLKTSELIGNIPTRIIRRAASFLLLSDSKASFEIEGERVPKNSIERWGKVINEAGKKELSLKEIERLHALLFQDARFNKIGLRDEGVFLGDHDRNGEPIPAFIGAKSEDLETLINSWMKVNKHLSEDKIDPVLQATVLAFSFVYIHPLQDGNGRLHRYLLHHVLGEREFYPKGMIFPISNMILDEITTYKDILEQHSSPLMESIKWEPTDKGNVNVLNETIDLYQFFDCTRACEFIYSCVEKTIEETLPEELNYLESFDNSYEEISQFIEMPDNQIKQIITFILQNKGILSKNKKEKYFDLMENDEVEKIQEIIKNHFSWKI
jgi:Fic family protein